MAPLHSAFRERDSWIVALGVLLLCLAWDISRSYPPSPQELVFDLTLPRGIPDRMEPLVVSGSVSKFNSLVVVYTGENSVGFAYESHGEALKSSVVNYVPGKRIRVQLQFPGLTSGSSNATAALLRMTLNGYGIFQNDAPFYPAPLTRTFFGEDPIGGPAVGIQFRGEMETTDGSTLRGRPDAFFSTSSKALHWLKTRSWRILPLFIMSALAAALLRAGLRNTLRSSEEISWLSASLQEHGAFLVSAGVCVLLFVSLMTGGEFRLIYPDAFGAYHDFQARSFLEGRLDIPPGSAGSEAFVVGGKHYSYFGIVPSLLRLPFIAMEASFGHMTRSFLLGYYIVSLLAGYAILRRVVALLSKGSRSPTRGAVVAMVLATGGGTLLFLGSRAYVHHEVILCGVAFALWSGYFSLRYFAVPLTRHWICALACGVLAVHSRPPVGLFALTFLTCAAAAHAFASRKPWRHAIAIGLAAAAGQLSLNALAYLKFGTLDAAPVKYHVQYSAERLAKTEGRNFHLVNVPHNLSAYLLSSGIEFRRGLFGASFNLKPPAFPAAKMDLEEPTAALPFGMVGLFVLAVVSLGFSLKHSDQRQLAATVLIASVPLAGCLLTFMATSHRYTADFYPPLVLLASIGLASIEQCGTMLRRTLTVVATGAAIFSIWLTLSLSFHFQAELVWGVPDEVRQTAVRLRP